jgi:hypothetical protein
VAQAVQSSSRSLLPISARSLLPTGAAIFVQLVGILSMALARNTAVAVRPLRCQQCPRLCVQRLEHRLQAYQLAMISPFHHMPTLMGQVGRPFQYRVNTPNEWAELTWQMDGMATVLLSLLAQGGKVPLPHSLQAQLVERFRHPPMCPRCDSSGQKKHSATSCYQPWSRDSLPAPDSLYCKVAWATSLIVSLKLFSSIAAHGRALRTGTLLKCAI